MACFADINVSQGSVATYARNGKFTKESSSEKFLKSIKIWQNYDDESVAPLFWPTLLTVGLKFTRPACRTAAAAIDRYLLRPTSNLSSKPALQTMDGHSTVLWRSSHTMRTA